MKLKEILDQLRVGELSQISVGGLDAGVIGATNWGTLHPHINLGLAALYKRFNLKEGRVVLALQPDQIQYSLHSRYAVSNLASFEAVKYIKDTLAAPFKDDINKIEHVYTDDGLELTLNDAADPYTLTTPSAIGLRVPKTMVSTGLDTPDYLKTTNLEVVYRAAHPKVGLPEDVDPEDYELELPYSHLEALLLFIASRVHNPIGMANEFHAGNSYAQKYEMECQRLEMLNLAIDQGNSSDRLYRNGWV